MSDIEIHILLLFVLADIQICSTKIHMGLGLSSCMKQCCLLSYQNYQTEICKEISKHIKGHISKIIKRIIVCIIYIYIQSIVSYHITSYRIISYHIISHHIITPYFPPTKMFLSWRHALNPFLVLLSLLVFPRGEKFHPAANWAFRRCSAMRPCDDFDRSPANVSCH